MIAQPKGGAPPAAHESRVGHKLAAVLGNLLRESRTTSRRRSCRGPLEVGCADVG